MSYCLTCIFGAAALGPAVLAAAAISQDFLRLHVMDDIQVMGIRLNKSGKSCTR